MDRTESFRTFLLIAIVISPTMWCSAVHAETGSAFERAIRCADEQDDPNSSEKGVAPEALEGVVALEAPSLTARLLVAATDFLIDRASAELRTAFLEELIENLYTPTDSTSWRPLEAFPTLKSTLASDTNALFLGPSTGKVLVGALQQDLDELPRHVFDVLPKTLRQSQEGRFLEQLLEFVRRLRQGVHPAVALEQWAAERSSPSEWVAAEQAIAELALYVSGLTHTVDGKREWISYEEFDQLTPRGLECLASEFQCDWKGDFGETELAILDSVEVLDLRVRRVLVAMDAVAGAVTRMRRMSWTETGELVTRDQRLREEIRYLQVSLTLVDAILRLYEGENEAEELEVERLRSLLQGVVRLVTAVHERSYADAAPAVLRILSEVAAEQPTDPNAGIPQPLRWLLTTAAEVADAESSKAMQAAIDHAVLPRGSYRAKQDSWGELYLNAYFGMAVGQENLLGEDVTAFESGINNLAAFAPVGVEFDMGGWCLFSSTSLFLAVIDLGALANYRLSESSDEVVLNAEGEEGMESSVDAEAETPDLSLRQVLAPGAFILGTFANKPIALGAGIQFLPSSRRVAFREEGLEDDTLDSYRVSMFLAVDIPIWKF